MIKRILIALGLGFTIFSFLTLLWAFYWGRFNVFVNIEGLGFIATGLLSLVGTLLMKSGRENGRGKFILGFILGVIIPSFLFLQMMK